MVVIAKLKQVIFLLKLSQLQQNNPNPPVITLPNVSPLTMDLIVTPLLDNAIVLFNIDICNFITKRYCSECITLVCKDVDNSFNSNLLILIDSIKHSSCRKKPTENFLHYTQSLYMLFNYYKNEIIYLSDIAKVYQNHYH